MYIATRRRISQLNRPILPPGPQRTGSEIWNAWLMQEFGPIEGILENQNHLLGLKFQYFKQVFGRRFLYDEELDNLF
ncbi:MAG: hypothetical protein C5B49_01250 [Bdellovibrio sp.]|nr:MAG: hypothetical protein C5B49_01250 [Bdellovibrio sp.]